MHRRIRTWIFAAFALFIALPIGLLSVPGVLWLNAWLHDRPTVEETADGFANDASHLNLTPVAAVWPIPSDPQQAEKQLRELLARARVEHLKISIAGARHSMGGHTIYRDGIVLDMLPFDMLELNATRDLPTAGAGARWSKIIPFLNAEGLSVAVMQSNNDFTVGGSVSVNCHGWQQNQPPIASTVESLRLMQADGTIVTCSRHENAELFSVVLGGYGLFGVILDVTFHVVPNGRYLADAELLRSEDYSARFADKVDSAEDIGMAYGRLCVAPGNDTFLREAILTVFRKAPCKPEDIPTLAEPALSHIRRQIYRAQIESATGKNMRWQAEKTLGEQLAGNYVSRNQLLDESATVYQEGNPDRTDILHEYFVPRNELEAFLERARQIIPRHGGDLLNVTIRDVKQDNDSFLRYADQNVFGLVMLFNQARTEEADQQMEMMTQALIDAALDCGGRYYLPYRLHATNEQFERAYPQRAKWLALKRHYDPDEVFQNEFYVKYGQ